MRCVALLCLWLAAGVGTAQAVHIHGEWLPDKAVHASLPAAAADGQGEERCTLCVAMHTAIPATLHAVPEPVGESARLRATQASAIEQRLQSFALFSRPPPSAARTLAATEASLDVSLAAPAAA